MRSLLHAASMHGATLPVPISLLRCSARCALIAAAAACWLPHAPPAGVARFAQKYPAVLDALLRTMLEMICKYHKTGAWVA